MNWRSGRRRQWIEALLGLIFPPVCQLCLGERAEARMGFVGARCRARVRPVARPFCERCGLPFSGALSSVFECSNCRDMELHFGWARAAVVANDVVLDLVHAYKYRHALCFEPYLARLLARAAGPSLRGGSWDMIVPVPLHPLKHRAREFNQAERLARRLGTAAGLRVETDVVRRAADTPSQTHLSRAERAENMRGAFAVRTGACLEDRRLVLVDDVLTTGATTNACALALREGGAAEVVVWTLARGT